MSQVNRSMSHMIKIRSTGLAGVQGHLSSLNPMAVLKRGYAIVTQPDGKLVFSISQVQTGNNLDVRLQDGILPVTVQSSPSAK